VHGRLGYWGRGKTRVATTLTNDAKLYVDLETKHFLIVYGGKFGAWCWYKTIALLE